MRSKKREQKSYEIKEREWASGRAATNAKIANCAAILLWGRGSFALLRGINISSEILLWGEKRLCSQRNHQFFCKFCCNSSLGRKGFALNISSAKSHQIPATLLSKSLLSKKKSLPPSSTIKDAEPLMPIHIH